MFMLSQQLRAGIPCQKLCVCKVHMEVKKHSAACSKAATLTLSLSLQALQGPGPGRKP